MKTGVWIDHRKARIVEISDGGESLRTIDSGVGKRVRLAGGSRSATLWGPQDIVSEPSRDRKYDAELKRYYDRVIESLADSEAIFLCGPAEAKDELKKRMSETGSLAERIVGFETQDKMTDNQLKAKVRAFFED